MTSQSKFKAGMYLLETLTSGMYNEPLSIYREYIQNAVDSIDLSASEAKTDFAININLDPFNKTITIFDNGEGISASLAGKKLSSIGSSEKIGTKQRGFRGIGRLGGIAFAEKAIFRTKAKGDTLESVQEWDCKSLRNLLADPSHASLAIEAVFDKVTSFQQRKSTAHQNESFFEVTLVGVKSFRNHIFDIAKVKEYLGQVAPLPFSPENFSFSDEIEHFLSTNLDDYGEYNIRLNGNQVFRPYTDNIKVTNKGGDDILEGIELVKLEINGSLVAVGWHGKRKHLLGAIAKGMGAAGIRVKAGNITIGDEHLLDKCFRENRFNSYIVGEIHVHSPELIANSRRDDFIDNDMKNLFYNALEKEIGLPISKEIRHRSRVGKDNANCIIDEKSGHSLSATIKKISADEAQEIVSQSDKVPDNFIMRAILAECKQCPRLGQILRNSQAI